MRSKCSQQQQQRRWCDDDTVAFVRLDTIGWSVGSSWKEGKCVLGGWWWRSAFVTCRTATAVLPVES